MKKLTMTMLLISTLLLFACTENNTNQNDLETQTQEIENIQTKNESLGNLTKNNPVTVSFEDEINLTKNDYHVMKIGIYNDEPEPAQIDFDLNCSNEETKKQPELMHASANVNPNESQGFFAQILSTEKGTTNCEFNVLYNNETKKTIPIKLNTN